MKTRRGKDRFIALTLGNIAIAVFVLILCMGYSRNVRSDKERAARGTFTAAVESAAQLSYGYMSSLQNGCDSWAAYIEDHGYSAEEAVEYLKEVNINSDVSVHVLYYGTLSGLSTGSGNNGNKVDYSQVAGSFTYILPLMINGTRREETVCISSACVNPVDGVNSIGFCSLLTVRDNRGGDARTILVKTIPVNVLHSQWLFPGAYREAEVSLIDISGRYVIQSGSMSGDTFWTFVRQNNGLSYVDIGRFQSSFQKEDKCLVELKDQAGEDAYYISSQIESALNCTFISYIQSKALVDIGFDWHMLFYVTIGFLLLLLLDGSHIMSVNRQLKKSVEKTQSANMTKTRFLSSMSHDIRTPMNAVIGMTAIARKDIDDPPQVLGCLEKVALASNHLLTLVSDVLDISIVESGKMTLHPVMFSLAKSGTNLVNIVRPQIKEKGLVFEIRLHHIAYKYLYADELRINQIFINLLSNAVKYTDPGGKVVLTLAQTRLPEDSGKMILTYTVQDTGIDMTREFMNDMYRNFTHAVDTRIDKVQGSGLGLAITKQLTDLMGGTIDCESEIGKGTKFTVTLTLPITETTTDDLVLPPLKLLLVDNDEVFLETAEDTLVSVGVTVDKTDNGRTAVEMAAARHEADQGYRVVLVGFKMPDMGGIETATAIRAKVGDEALIIIISAYDWTEIEDAARAAGVHAFINKPMFKSVIYDKMNEFLHFSKVETASADEDAGGLQGLRLLVAEDNDLNWEIIEEMLKYYDISTVRAENGQICIELLCSAGADTYGAVLVDIQMPVMNGRDASRATRALPDKVKRDIPIIAMTADTFAEDIQACLEAGMNGHAAKPIDMKKLFGELKDAGLANGRRGEVG